MTVVRGLYERFRQLIHEAAKFGVVGVVGVLITNVGYAVLHSTFGMGPVSATTIATIVATAVSYVANRYWSFRHRERTSVAREGTIFFVLNGVGLVIQDAVVAFNFYILGYGHNKAAEFIALNVGIALATLFRFWSYRKWVWAAPADAAGTSAGGLQPQPSNPGAPQALQASQAPPMAHSSGHPHAPGQNGNGAAPHSPDLLHANGRAPTRAPAPAGTAERAGSGPGQAGGGHRR